MGAACGVNHSGKTSPVQEVIPSGKQEDVQLEANPLVEDILKELNSLTMADVRQILSARAAGGPGLPDSSLKIVLDAIRAHRSTMPKKQFDIDVASVAPVAAADAAAFKEQWVSKTKVSGKTEVDGEIFVSERLRTEEIEVQVQFNRWAWAQANKETYVNMLRVSGHSDANIQAMCDGKRPLNFTNAELHAEFRRSLKLLGENLEKEMGWKNVRFVQMGSATAGYSSNPQKGVRDRPSKITDPASSDVDLCVVGDGVGEWARRQKTGTWRTRDTLSFDRRGERPIYEAVDTRKVCKALQAWLDKWDGKILEGGVQMTFVEHPNPFVFPWACLVDTRDDEQQPSSVA